MVVRPHLAVGIVSVVACSRSALLDPSPSLEAGGQSSEMPSVSGGTNAQTYSRSSVGQIGSRPNPQTQGGTGSTASATATAPQGGLGGLASTSTLTEVVAEQCPNTEFFGTHWFPIPAPVAGTPTTLGGSSDLNGDSFPDFVLGYAGVVSVLLGSGPGQFAPHRDFSTWEPMTSPITADFNQDGFGDIVYLIPEWNSLRIIQGNAASQLTAGSELYIPSSTERKLIASTDFDGGGAVDLVVSDTTTYLDVLEGAPNSLSFTRTQLIALSTPIVRVQTLDINGDQRIDLVSIDAQGTVSVYLQTDNHSFAEKVTTATESTPQSISFGLLDADKFADFAGASKGKLLKCRGTGDGTFACSPPSNITATLVRIVDLDSDGTNDLAIADGVSGSLCTSAGTRNFITITSPTCIPFISEPLDINTGDFDADGTVDLAAIGASTAALGISWGGPARRHSPDFGIVTESLGSIPTAVQVTDYDGDRLLDVVFASTSSKDVHFWKGTGDGHFQKDSALSVGFEPTHLRTGDFDGDGTVDVVAIDKKSNLVVTQGRKTVVLSEFLDAPYDLLEVSDLNQDGHQDLFLAQTGTTNCLALLGLGTGQFQHKIAIQTTNRLTNIAIGDLNQDKIPELITTSYSSLVEIYPGLGNGRFGTSSLYSSKETAYTLALADQNHDGITDIIVTHNSLRASLLVGKGNRAFDFSRLVELGGPADDAKFADFDVDGHLDVLTANYQSKVLGLALGNGDSSFGRTFSFLGNAYPTDLNIGDVNRDGRPDIVYGDRASPTLVTRLNSCP